MSIVKYHNELNKIVLTNLSSKETDIFFTIIYKMKEKTEATFSSNEIKSFLSGDRHSERFFDSLKNVFKTQLRIYENKTITDYHLFITKKLNETSGDVFIKLHPDCFHILNGLIENYTKFELEEFINLKSEYSKKLFRLLMQFKDTGKVVFEMDKFKTLLEIPINYRQTNIDQKVLAPILKELKPVFKSFKIEKKKQGKFITHIIFTWKPQHKEIKEFIQEKKSLVEKIPLYSQDLENLYLLCKIQTEEIKKLIFEKLKKINSEIIKSNIIYSNKNAKDNYFLYLKKAIEEDYSKQDRELQEIQKQKKLKAIQQAEEEKKRKEEKDLQEQEEAKKIFNSLNKEKILNIKNKFESLNSFIKKNISFEIFAIQEIIQNINFYKNK